MKAQNQNAQFHTLACGSLVKIRLLPEHVQYSYMGNTHVPDYLLNTFKTGIITKILMNDKRGIKHYNVLITSGSLKGQEIIIDYKDRLFCKALMLPALGLEKAEKFLRRIPEFQELQFMDGYNYLQCSGHWTKVEICHQVNIAIRDTATSASK